jgi:hypothetical protein
MQKFFAISVIGLLLLTVGCGGSQNTGANAGTVTQPGSGSGTGTGSGSGSGAGSGSGSGSGNGSGNNSSSVSVSTAFTAGITHVDGKYRFTDDNYLIEGAQKISDVGSNSIFIYLTPSYRTIYPDESSTNWPASDPAGLDGLAQTGPYDQVFQMPFTTIVMTAFTFANSDRVEGIAQATDRLNAEENEFYNLTKYLYSHFTGSGKTFVLKNWETDSFAEGMGNTQGDIPQNVVNDLIAWLSARQRGVSRARSEANDSSVLVLNGAEVNRVLDYAQNGLRRVINAVVPNVGADMLTYSSYDAMVYGSNAQAVQQTMTQALQTIEKMAPDPQGLGNRRILISEYGLFETEQPGDMWRADTVLSTSKNAGLFGAFLWNVYDNECKENGQYAPVASAEGDPARPTDADCRGLWVVRPDGTTSGVLDVLKKYW